MDRDPCNQEALLHCTCRLGLEALLVPEPLREEYFGAFETRSRLLTEHLSTTRDQILASGNGMMGMGRVI